MLLAGAAALGLAASATTSWGATTYGPDNTVTVVDPSPVNWLSITWNTMEEANRVDMDGKEQRSLAESWKWVNPTTLELKMRKNVTYQDGSPFTAKNMKTAFDKVNSWSAPHRHKEIRFRPASPNAAPCASRISKSPSIRIEPSFKTVIFVSGMKSDYLTRVPIAWAAKAARA